MRDNRAVRGVRPTGPWPEYMSLQTLASYSEISVNKLRMLLKGPRPIPCLRLGRILRVQRSVFDAWMRAHAAPSVDSVLDDLRADRARRLT